MDHIAEEYTNLNSQINDYFNDNLNNNSNDNSNDELNNTKRISENIFEAIKTPVHEEYQYLNLIESILDNGTWEEGRNGKTKSIFGYTMRFSLKNGNIPILTTKKTAWKTCLKELLWFIRGDTDNINLNTQGVRIWDLNASKEFLETRGLNHYPDGILGPLYGYQWRHFNAPYDFNNAKPYTEDNELINKAIRKPYGITPIRNNIDQLQYIIDQLSNPRTRNNRRLIMTAWNPCQLDDMALPPCHILCQFNVHNENQLSCALYQRSCDCFLGLPFNIASYSFLTHLIAKHCGLEAYEFIHFMGNSHIYEDHIDCCKLQIERNPYTFPKINIKNTKENINDYNVEDFEITDYKSHEAIKANMIA